MDKSKQAVPKTDAGEVRRQAEQKRLGIVREFWDFLRFYKKWWLLPIIIALLLLGLLVFLSNSPLAPFIYTF